MLTRHYGCMFWHCWKTLAHRKFWNLGLLQSFITYSASIPEPYMCECFVDLSIGTGLHNNAFQLVVVFCNDLYLFQRKISWYGVRAILICVCKDKCLKCSYELHWLSEVVVIVSPPESVTSWALGRWLGLQYKTYLLFIRSYAQLESCWLPPR